VKFLLDQDVYAVTGRFLRSRGHDVLTAHEAGLSQADDTVLLDEAKRQGRVMVTRDRDYGGLVFLRRQTNAVIYLRMTPSAVIPVHDELARVLTAYSETDLMRAFVVVEPGRHRLRHLRD
jgi:predicted nuclease of predicted toxin-antitoxin system